MPKNTRKQRRIRGGLNTPNKNTPNKNEYTPNKGEYISVRTPSLEENYVLASEDSLVRNESASKKAKNASPVWDRRVDYVELMQNYIGSQRDMFVDLNKKLVGDEKDPIYIDISRNISQLNLIVNDNETKNITTLPINEKKAMKKLGEIFRDQINLLLLKKKTEDLISELIQKNKTKQTIKTRSSMFSIFNTTKKKKKITIFKKNKKNKKKKKKKNHQNP